ncbi:MULTISPECIES: hypothetical protein [Streptomyces]|jgi:hypothetical protein|uniref:hypothetical protein n=1 Tax=Streptomyces TaxID=1883 RepID=UPI0015CF3E0A|nr:hypothetical protein [Streptomyces sp. OV198]
MLLGVQGKASCRRTLRALSETDERHYAEHLDTLLERADRQSALLEEMRIKAATRTLPATQRQGA